MNENNGNNKPLVYMNCYKILIAINELTKKNRQKLRNMIGNKIKERK